MKSKKEIENFMKTVPPKYKRLTISQLFLALSEIPNKDTITTVMLYDYIMLRKFEEEKKVS